jgi:flagellar motility protein MotE (MotC chaperone)
MKRFLIIFTFLIIITGIFWLLNYYGLISSNKIFAHIPFLREYFQKNEIYNELLEEFNENRISLESLKLEKDRLNQALEAARMQIEEYISSITKLEEELTQARTEQLNKKERLDRLVKIYSEMSPEAASRIFPSLDDELIRDLLLNMKADQAAAILSVLPSEDAASYSRALK